nr:hypothetical protein [Tanacetum cinerariifolium]
MKTEMQMNLMRSKFLMHILTKIPLFYGKGHQEELIFTKVKVSHAVVFEQETKQDVKQVETVEIVKQVETVEIVKQKRISTQQPKVTPDAKQAHNVKRLLSARLNVDWVSNLSQKLIHGQFGLHRKDIILPSKKMRHRLKKCCGFYNGRRCCYMLNTRKCSGIVLSVPSKEIIKSTMSGNGVSV